MKTDRFKTVLAIILVQIPLAVIAQPTTPIDIARQFYRWNIKLTSTLPSDRELAPIESLLDPSLLKSLRQARAVEICLTKLATRSRTKPDIFEGNLFVDNYEGVSKIGNIKVSTANNIATVTASLSYYHYTAWKTKSILRKQSDRWLIADVKYRSGGSLVKNLTGYIDLYRSTCKIN
jgi:hypothetical protein